MKSEGRFMGIASDKIDLNDPIGTHKDFALDENLALEIGTLTLKSVYGESKILDTYFIVREDNEREFFIITRIPNNNIPGADYNIAINKKDAKILRIWMGE